MKRRTPPAPRRAAAPARGSFRRALPRERRLVVALLALHAALAVWGAARNSVTFDENFHLPAGVAIVTLGDFGVSPVNPPLVKALCALPALAAGARRPPDEAFTTGNQLTAGIAFMRANADRYHRVYFAARLVPIALSVALALLVWRFARRLYGPRGGLLALGFYALAPEALAHAGLATMDVATALGFLATIDAFWIFLRSGRWAAWAACAVSLGALALTRFSAWIALPILAALVLAALPVRGLPRPRRAAVGLALLPLTTLLALQVGYLGKTSLRPLGQWELHSRSLVALQAAAPGLRLPLPDDYLAGFDWQARESEPAHRNPSYLLGRTRPGNAWAYFPLALLFKWPLGFLGALAVRAVHALRSRRGPKRRWDEAVLLLPAALFLAGAMVVGLGAGVRYLLPVLPLLCVWLGGLAVPRAPRATPRRNRWLAVGAALLMLQAIETAACAPWWLSFYNAPSGGPGRGEFLINDSNVDWGQGLIALREELERRGIRRVHLAYHGTVDPAVYGIDYVPYAGGNPGPQSEWIAISSYYFVGLSQRMMTPRGPTEAPITIDFRALWGTPPVATPAHCMKLFPIVRTPAR